MKSQPCLRRHITHRQWVEYFNNNSRLGRLVLTVWARFSSKPIPGYNDPGEYHKQPKEVANTSE